MLDRLPKIENSSTLTTLILKIKEFATVPCTDVYADEAVIADGKTAIGMHIRNFQTDEITELAAHINDTFTIKQSELFAIY